MRNLTAKEIVHLNMLNYDTKHMKFGEMFQTMISELKASLTTGTPVNAVNAINTLTVTGVVLDKETLTINNPAIVGSDVYEFLATSEQELTTPTNIGVSIEDYIDKAAVVLTLPTKPTAGDTMTIGAKVYTFVAVGAGTSDGDIDIGAGVADARLNIVSAINGVSALGVFDEFNVAHSEVVASNFVGSDCTITAIEGGVAGNSIVSEETFAAIGNVFAAETLLLGADCSAADAITALVAEITAHDTQGVGAVDGDGDTITLTADTAGVIGNAIVASDTMTNVTYAGGSGTFSRGVDGTIGVKGQEMIDDTYLYKAIAANTISGKNWCRLALANSVGVTY